MSKLSECINNVHCIMQELENAGVELPMGDYDSVYSVLEEVRDIHESPSIFLMGNLSDGFVAYGPYHDLDWFEIHDGDEGWGMSLKSRWYSWSDLNKKEKSNPSLPTGDANGSV